MPVDTTMYPTTHETEAVFTGCICPNARHSKIHEPSCPTQIPNNKPSPYAGKRAWKQYMKRKKL